MIDQHGEWTKELQTHDYGVGHYWPGGDHGCELIQTEICTLVPMFEWTKIYFTAANYDTDGFFDTAIPGCLILPAPGFYVCTACIGWPGTGHVSTNLEVEIRSAIWGPIAYDIGHPPSSGGDKFMNTFGQAPLEQGEEIGVYVKSGSAISTLINEGDLLCPKLTIQWIKNFYGYVP